MNGFITFIEMVGPEKGQHKTFPENQTKDIMFGKIFQKIKWEDIEPQVVPEDRARARELYEEEMVQFISLTGGRDATEIVKEMMSVGMKFPEDDSEENNGFIG